MPSPASSIAVNTLLQIFWQPFMGRISKGEADDRPVCFPPSSSL
jgi:hypothetical protein